jgi:hypothetical protein
MIASRITKAFQLIALALAFSVLNVYVMAGPIRTPIDPRTTDPTASQPTAEKIVAEKTSDKTAAATTQVASEKMPLTAGTKSVLTRIFSKQNVEARAATTSSFLSTKTNFADTFKTKANAQTSGKSSDNDSEGHGSRSTWIALGVIAAVLTLAVIGLRHDRSHPDAATGL